MKTGYFKLTAEQLAKTLPWVTERKNVIETGHYTKAALIENVSCLLGKQIKQTHLETILTVASIKPVFAHDTSKTAKSPPPHVLMVQKLEKRVNELEAKLNYLYKNLGVPFNDAN